MMLTSQVIASVTLHREQLMQYVIQQVCGLGGFELFSTALELLKWLLTY